MNDAANLRRAFQKELATARSKQGKTKNVYRDKKIERREGQRESSARIKRMNGSARTVGGLNKIVASDANGNWIKQTDKILIEKSIIQRLWTLCDPSKLYTLYAAPNERHTEKYSSEQNYRQNNARNIRSTKWGIRWDMWSL